MHQQPGAEAEWRQKAPLASNHVHAGFDHADKVTDTFCVQFRRLAVRSV